MIKFSFTILVFLITFIASDGQTNSRNIRHPLSESIKLDISSGITFGKSDFVNTKFGPEVSLNLSYFFSSYRKNLFGLSLYTGWHKFKGKGNNLGFPDEFSTDIFKIGGGVIYSVALSNLILPYAKAGVSYNLLSPKFEGARSDLYKNNGTVPAIGFDGEIGINLAITELIGIDIGASINFVQNDKLDNIDAGVQNDFVMSGIIGLSWAFNRKRDSDGDGINNDLDLCPDQKEDFDGFKDNDGCPELDNDADGIPDIEDLCPDLAEDFDGFQDNDGCPDLDNDGDGIEDRNDECPDLAEDFDNFQDDDGCPDYDNDADGLLDLEDGCPDSPEDKDGFEDLDGCPDLDNDGDGIPDLIDVCPDAAEDFDQDQDDDGCPEDDQVIIEKKPPPPIPVLTSPLKVEPKEILLHGELLFHINAATLKQEAVSELNSILLLLQANKNSRWRIEGHMDSKGAKKDIHQLSVRRARAVYNYFVSKGIDSSRFEIYGMGDKFPIASNKNAYGRMRNRRVILIRID